MEETLYKNILSPYDLCLLSEQSAQVLAHWHDLLNKWEWPLSIPNPEQPYNYPIGGRRKALLKYITTIVGQRYLSWMHNKDHMSENEFEIWWQENEPHQESVTHNA